MKHNLIISVLIVILIQCFYAHGKEAAEPKCVVPFGFIINPASELISFKIYQPGSCAGVRENLDLSEAWKRTACVQFSMMKINPTYEAGEKPREKYATFFYDKKRPDVLFIRADSGISPTNPVVYIQESIMNAEGKHICHGNLDALIP